MVDVRYGLASEASGELFKDEVGRISEQIGIPNHEAFPRWICHDVLGIEDEGEVDEAVSIGGKGDYGIDIFYADDGAYSGERSVYIIQAKFSENLEHSVTREEIESFTGTLNHLRRCPKGANKVFKQKSSEFQRIEAQYPNIRKHMIFAVAGKPNSQVCDLICDDAWRREKIGSSPNIHFEILDLDKILSYIVSQPTPEIKIRLGDQIIEKTDTCTGKKSILGYIDARQLVELAKQHRETIFLENPRQTLGDTAPTHKAILGTLSDPRTRQRFWKLNNGITSICKGFEKVGDSEYLMRNFRIVNGRQTTYTLEKSPHPIDDVSLLIAVHEAVDEDERNQISEATNTQNPIKPIDLVTNYGEMIDLVIQCKRKFPEFYFERQTKGFKSAKKSVQNRVTKRRLLEKNTTARSYYAYAIDPNGAMISDKDLFSTVAPNHYDKVFRNRDIRDLIIPHIFRKMLDELHRKWCKEQRDDPSDRTIRNKGIISKDIVKYYILRFIYESMTSIEDADVRERVRTNMIETFRNLKKEDAMPKEFLEIAEIAYNTFIINFDVERKETWPKDLLERRSQKNYKVKPDDVPSPYEIMYELKRRGPVLLPSLLHTRENEITLHGDELKKALVNIASD